MQLHFMLMCITPLYKSVVRFGEKIIEGEVRALKIFSLYFILSLFIKHQKKLAMFM